MKTYQILTNLDCNLACTYCYEHKGKGANNITDIKDYLDIASAEKQEETYIDLIGGETLLYPEMLDQICEHLSHKNKPFTVGLSTNGTLIAGNENVKKIISKWKNNLSIGFSIDGTKKIHDACRIDKNGNGSYDRAVEGYKWLREIICPRKIGVKATFCHETINSYAESVINLIKLGFTNIAANAVFEEIWNETDCITIISEMRKITDYIFENNMQDTVTVQQINMSGIDMENYTPNCGKKTANYCGTCKYMRCLGYNGEIFGCNRFATMKNPRPIGLLSNGEIIITEQNFIEKVSEQYKQLPEDCKNCDYAHTCASCSAVPYEYADPKAYLDRKGQCGFTYATVAARLYYKMKLLAEKLKKETSANDCKPRKSTA